MAKKQPATRVVSPQDLLDAYRQVFSTSEGQIVLADLMRKFSFTRQSTMPDSCDVNVMLMQEGARTVLVRIGRMLDGDPSLVEEQKQEMD